ncbi:MAG: hypothetical protein IPG94_15875 [Kineosporiaceae bacterium]|nr:hypothetical protein [Kineosporiaceae bacterium]
MLVTARHVLIDAGVPAGELLGGVVSIDALAPGVAPAVPARVVAVDQHSDLAVLEREEPLPGTAASVVASGHWR